MTNFLSFNDSFSFSYLAAAAPVTILSASTLFYNSYFSGGGDSSDSFPAVSSSLSYLLDTRNDPIIKSVPQQDIIALEALKMLSEISAGKNACFSSSI